MLSPALTVVISLLLVAVIGYLISSATGKRTASSSPTALVRRMQRERDEALSENQARLRSRQDEIEALRSENSVLEHRLADRQTVLDVTTSDRDVHAGRLQEVTRELETLRRQVTESSASDADADGVDVGALRRDLEGLGGQLNNQGGQLREALQGLAARDEETDKLRQELEAAQANMVTLAADNDSQEVGLLSTDGSIRTAAIELEEARSTIVDLETRHDDEIRWRDARITELEAAPQAAPEVEIWLTEVRQELAQSEEDRAQLTTERDEATHRLAAMEDQISGSGERVSRLQDELNELERRYGQQVHELDDEVQQLRRRLEERTEETQRLRDERRSSGERIDRDGEELRQANARMDGLTAERDDLAASLTALTGDFQERAEAKALESDYVVQIERRDQQLKELQARADAAGTRLLDAQEQARAHVLHIEELNDSLQALEARMARNGERRVELDRLVAKLMEQRQLHVEQAEASLAERDSSIERFEQRLVQQTEMLARRDQQVKNDRERIESLQAEVEERTAATERSLRERDLEMDRMRRTLEAQLEEIQTSDETVQRLEQEVTGMRSMLGQERAQALGAQAQLGTRISELQAAETTQTRNQAVVESIQADMADMEASYERLLRERQLALDGIAGMLPDRETELAEYMLQTERANHDGQVAEARIKRRDARIETLEAEMIRADDTRERLLRELHEREIEGRQMRSLLRVEPPAGDDLTAIKGIGSKTAELLNAAGIFTYNQIAAWNQSDVKWIEARAPRLAGRIRLEKWVQGARAAAQGEFGVGYGSTE